MNMICSMFPTTCLEQRTIFTDCSISFWHQIEWDTDPGTREVQWVKTYAAPGPNEIQTITTTADDVDEIQQLMVSANETLEVQVRSRNRKRYRLLYAIRNSVILCWFNSEV